MSRLILMGSLLSLVPWSLALPKPPTSEHYLLSAMNALPSSGNPLSLIKTSGQSKVSFTYDNALAALALTRRGMRAEAEQILMGLGSRQLPNGAIPFSISFSEPNSGVDYIRTGSVAWAGYAAVVFLNADKGGSHRREILSMAHKVASFLESRLVDTATDSRAGLITGGSGEYKYALENDQLKETFVPGEAKWVATEHNIDSYFFFHALAGLTHTAQYEKLADKIKKATLTRLWNASTGQFYQGATVAGPDNALALDCASWGSLFLSAIGEKEKAELALQSAERRFFSRDDILGLTGHRPYVARPIIGDAALAKKNLLDATSNNWDRVQGVWPEGSAGVALAAWRLGHHKRAKEIVSMLEKLRGTTGILPDFTQKVPLEFESSPNFAAMAWLDLVQQELGSPPWLWNS